MKQFLYLDTDIVASIIAQSEKGLITQMTREQGGEEGTEKEKSVSANVKASGGGALWKLLQAEVELGGEGEIRVSKIFHSSSKEIIEKTLHDASFDIACSYIQPHESLAEQSAIEDAGAYIKIKRAFTFVDLLYLEGLFMKEGVVDLFQKMEAKQKENGLVSTRDELNREQRRQPNTTAKKQKETDKSMREGVADCIKMIKGLVPCSRMLISFDGYLIPLDDKYFRIDPSNFGFKYGGETTCVGLITNIISENTEQNHFNGIFGSVQFTIYRVLRSILNFTNKSLHIVHPIAVYYGE